MYSLSAFRKFFLVTVVAPPPPDVYAATDLVCRLTQSATTSLDLCEATGCFWLEAKEQDGFDTGRCYQCSQQRTQEGCEATGACLWIPGREALGGSDCTICAGRQTQQDCEANGCFWNLPGYENVCSKCPGHTDADSCSAAGCFWRKVQGVEKCVKCGGFVTEETCVAAACKWNPDGGKVKCKGNPEIFLLPVDDSDATSNDNNTSNAAGSVLCFPWFVFIGTVTTTNLFV